MSFSAPRLTQGSRHHARRLALALAVAPLVFCTSLTSVAQAAATPAATINQTVKPQSAIDKFVAQIAAYLAPSITATKIAVPKSAPVTPPPRTPVPVVPVEPVVTAGPKITVQPQSLVLAGGASAAFSVSATGTGSITYQWARGGVPIAGATSSTLLQPVVAMSDNGAAFSVAVKDAAGTTVSAVARLTVNAAAPKMATAARLFSDQSLWNARPTKYTLGTYEIPTSSYWPSISAGPYSTAASVASVTDPAVTIMGPVGQGIVIGDANEVHPSITIPHWPAHVTLASGSDGHADIIDVAANRIHSFWQLRNDNGQWRAVQYSWTPLNGSGWPTPGQFRVGPRATGVASIAGVIRVAEISDGLPIYRHALAMSMTFNGLSATTPYVFPATSADDGAQSSNSGQIPEGALMMLPPDFDLSTISDPNILKLARTLMTFGAYVVDRNDGVPVAFYVENPTDVDFMKNWDWGIMLAMDAIRSKLRPVVSTSEWVDANGAVFVPNHNLNLLSMQGYWGVTQGTTAGAFDTWKQAVVFPDNGIKTVQQNTSGNSMPAVTWAAPVAGKHYKLTVRATGGATLNFILASNGTRLGATGDLGDGESFTMVWPTTPAIPNLVISSGPQGGGTISATLVRVEP